MCDISAGLQTATKGVTFKMFLLLVIVKKTYASSSHSLLLSTHNMSHDVRIMKNNYSYERVCFNESVLRFIKHVYLRFERLKGKVHPKMKICTKCDHPQIIRDVDFEKCSITPLAHQCLYKLFGFHSDGTHSLQRIYWWASATFL